MHLTTWGARLAWLAVAVVGGRAIGDATATRSDPVQIVATVGAWCGWAAGAIALAVPAVATLTAVRVIVPGAIAVTVTCLAFGADPGASLALGVPAVICGGARRRGRDRIGVRPGVGVRGRAADAAAPSARLPGGERGLVDGVGERPAGRPARVGGSVLAARGRGDARGGDGELAAPPPLASAQPALAGDGAGRAGRARSGRARRDGDVAPPTGQVRQARRTRARRDRRDGSDRSDPRARRRDPPAGPRDGSARGPSGRRHRVASSRCPPCSCRPVAPVPPSPRRGAAAIRRLEVGRRSRRRGRSGRCGRRTRHSGRVPRGAGAGPSGRRADHRRS